MGIFTGNEKIRTFNELKYFKNAKMGYNSNTFYGCTSLEEVTITDELGNGATINGDQKPFAKCPLKKYVGAVTGPYIFQYTYGSEIDLSKSFIKTTNLTSLFYDSKYVSIDISHWDTTGVISMKYMFGMSYNVTAQLTSLVLPPNFINTSVEDISNLFQYQKKLTTINVSDWDTSNVTNMSNTFTNCTALTSLDVSNFDTSNVTNMNGMFSNCYKITSIDLSSFDTSKVTNMSTLFGAGTGNNSCYVLASLKVSDKFFNCVTRATSPLTTIDFRGAQLWKDVQEITDVLNLLPDLTGGAYTATSATLQLHTNTKTVINNNSLASIATDKGWTIA